MSEMLHYVFLFILCFIPFSLFYNLLFSLDIGTKILALENQLLKDIVIGLNKGEKEYIEFLDITIQFHSKLRNPFTFLNKKDLLSLEDKIEVYNKKRDNNNLSKIDYYFLEHYKNLYLTIKSYILFGSIFRIIKIITIKIISYFKK